MLMSLADEKFYVGEIVYSKGMDDDYTVAYINLEKDRVLLVRNDEVAFDKYIVAYGMCRDRNDKKTVVWNQGHYYEENQFDAAVSYVMDKPNKRKGG